MGRISYNILPLIHVIDDSLTDCLLIQNSLQQEGFEVSYSTDGREGFAKIMNSPPHCLILDVILPDLNGYTICRKVRARDPQHTLPIIAISTKNSELDQHYMLGLGADRFLGKPFTAKQLIQTVLEALPERIGTLANARKPAPVPLAAPEVHIQTLIPFRQHAKDILWGSNPFSSNAGIADQQLRQLYAAIDNRRSVQELSMMMQLDLGRLLKLVEKLWQQQHIQVYSAEGKPLAEGDFTRLLTEYLQKQ
ncbi:MAG TPA: response regulator [Ktedonobacteraceae bacterium]|nr:response regulator [Ktedonobacteraceae bacterium]